MAYNNSSCDFVLVAIIVSIFLVVHANRDARVQDIIKQLSVSSMQRIYVAEQVQGSGDMFKVSHVDEYYMEKVPVVIPIPARDITRVGWALEDGIMGLEDDWSDIIPVMLDYNGFFYFGVVGSLEDWYGTLTVEEVCIWMDLCHANR